MADETIRWFDDEPEGPPPSRRTRWLLVAAVAPWLVVVLVIARSGPGDPTSVAPAAVAAAQAATGDADDTGDDGTGQDGTGAHPTEQPETAPAGSNTEERSGGGAGVPVDRAGDVVPSRIAYGVAEALAVATTRAWLSDAGPDLPAPDIDVHRGAYLEHVVVERIDLVDPQVAVATVSVVLLERDGDVYGGAALRRVAVPLTVTPSTVHVGGSPWWLPTALDLTLVPPDLDAHDDPAASHATTDALTAAGYRDVTVHRLATTAAGIVVAEVEATTGSGDRIDGPVWLRAGGDGLELLGHHRDDRT